MATLSVYNLKNEEVGTIEVSDAVFAGEVKRHLFYEVIKWQLAKRRAGTAATKGRNDVAGGGAKSHSASETACIFLKHSFFSNSNSFFLTPN